MSSTSADLHDDCVVVFKNLALESTTHDIESALKSLKITSTSIDRKVDSSGHFRGIAFVRFSSADKAAQCVEKLDAKETIIHGKKLKAELLRKPNRGRAYSAKEVLEPGVHVDAKAARVRDIITNFVYSDRTETHLPADLDADQRKLAHSLAEKFGLVHSTRHYDDRDAGSRSVFLSKARTNGKKPDAQHEKERESKSLLKSHASSHVPKKLVAGPPRTITPLIPHAHAEIPVFAAPISHAPPQSSVVADLSKLAIMHAAQAQVHADAARAALEAARRSRETDAMPAWLEIVEPALPRTTAASGSIRLARGNSKAKLNPNAPAFVPSASFSGPPPGLSRVH